MSSSSSSSAVDCYIIVQKQALEKYVAGSDQGYRLRVRCTEASCCDTNIFIYHSVCVNPFTGQYQDEFDHVASPSDLEEFPIGSPSEDTDAPQYYRHDELDVVLRSELLAGEAWETLTQEIKALVQSLKKVQDNNLTAVSTYLIDSTDVTEV